MKYNKYITSGAIATTFAALAVMILLSGNLANAAEIAGVNATASISGGGGQHMGWGARGSNPGGPMIQARPAVFGTVASINGTSLTVTEGAHRGFGSSTVATATTTYTVDASTATVIKNNATSSISSITVGDMVAVQGSVNGTNVTATSIRDGFEMRMGPAGGEGNQNGFHHSKNASSSNNMPPSPITGNGQPVVAGSITAINGTSLTITNKSSVSYTVDASNAKIVDGQNTVTVSSLSVGDDVLIQGNVNGTSITATSVIDQKAPNTSTGTSGTITPTNPHGKGGVFGMIGGFFSRIFGF